jgi:hypothetical protein
MKEIHLNKLHVRIGNENLTNLNKSIKILESEGWKLIEKYKPGGTYFADMERVLTEKIKE